MGSYPHQRPYKALVQWICVCFIMSMISGIVVLPTITISNTLEWFGFCRYGDTNEKFN